MKSFFNFLMLIFHQQIQQKDQLKLTVGKEWQGLLRKNLSDSPRHSTSCQHRKLSFLIQVALLCITSQSFLWTTLSLKPPTCLLWLQNNMYKSLAMCKGSLPISHISPAYAKRKMIHRKRKSHPGMLISLRKLIIGLTPY